jgi:hypothetical protein
MASSDPASQIPTTLPANWLEEIKAAVKQSWGKVVLTTILGSSVVGSLVSFGGNYWLESRKANWEMQKKGREEAVEAYGNLGKQVEELQADLASAVLTFEYAVKSGAAVKGSKHEFIKNVDNSILIVASKIADVKGACRNVRIDDASIKQNTANAVDELPAYLSESQSDKSALQKVINLFRSKLNPALDKLKAEIENKRESIRVG